MQGRCRAPRGRRSAQQAAERRRSILKQLQTLGCGTKDIRTSIEIIDASPWSPKLDTFARRLAAGVLPMGKATGCKLAPDYAATTHGCLLCDGPDGIEH